MRNEQSITARVVLCLSALLICNCVPVRASESREATTTRQFPDEPTRQELAKWDRDSENLLRSHLTSVASRGDAGSLVAAALLWPAWDESPGVRRRDDKQRQVWFAKLATLTPRSPVATWVQANGCFMGQVDGCASEQALGFLLETEPKNAAVQLLAMRKARDDDGIEGYWRAAVEGDRFDSHTRELGMALLDAVENLPLPPLNPDQAETMGEALGLNRPITEHDARGALAMSAWMNHAIPEFTSIRERCQIKDPAALEPTRREQCMKILALLETDQSTLFTPMISLTWQVMMGGETGHGIATRERLRQLHWLYENGSIAPQSAQSAPMPEDYADAMLLHGELAAMRLVLKSKSLSATAPDGWLPTRENARSLVVSGKRSENL